MGDSKPGERVLKSGVYRVYHDPHRLMHEATLLRGDLFPRCIQCGAQVRFRLRLEMRDHEILPFRSGEILEAFPPPPAKSDKMAG